MWYNGAGGDFLTHLLVVDDEVSILELIKNSLGKDGWMKMRYFFLLEEKTILLFDTTPNSPGCQKALHLQCRQAHFCRSSHKANYRKSPRQ